MLTKAQVAKKAKRSYKVEVGTWYFVREEKGGTPRTLRGSADACQVVGEYWSQQPDYLQERVVVLTLDTKNRPLSWHTITIGSLDAAHVHPREVFRPAIIDGARSIIITHNHPSGDPTPGSADIAVTKRLVASGKIIGIDVLDHIVAGDTCHSIRESNPQSFDAPEMPSF
jgi:DNA repair protein RadC